jgi:hypothetical protein
MLLNDVPQPWNKMTGKVWVPDGASGKLPLVVYLHGIIDEEKGIDPAARMIADDATLKSDKWSMSTSNLVDKLIKAGKIKPIAVAAPSETLPNSKRGKGLLWKNLNFGSFVDEVVKKVKENQMAIDTDKVSVVGWSGAGCIDDAGLAKVAKEYKKLFLLGCADTCVNGNGSKRIQDALGSSSTPVYSIHEDVGGGGPKYFDEPAYLAGFGVKRDLKGKKLPSEAEDADQAAFQIYRDNGDDKNPPTRTVAKVAVGKKGLELHWPYFDMPARQPHGQVPLVWTYYALQRFFKK